MRTLTTLDADRVQTCFDMRSKKIQEEMDNYDKSIKEAYKGIGISFETALVHARKLDKMEEGIEAQEPIINALRAIVDNEQSGNLSELLKEALSSEDCVSDKDIAFAVEIVELRGEGYGSFD